VKLQYKKIDKKPEHSYLARRETIPCLDEHWHFHEEFELIYFLRSSGTRYVGNTINNFKEGEIYLIGSNLPHLFQNDRDYYLGTQTEGAVDLIIVQFNRFFLGEAFYVLPEAINLEVLLQKSFGGLKFSRMTSSLLHSHLVGLPHNKGLSGIINLLKILDVLSISEEYEVICSEAVHSTFRKNEKERMARIISYLTENFEQRIELEEIASVARMAPNAFCRFFKNKTRKSFSQYLNEIRIGHACKMLIEGSHQISEVSYMSGFNSLSNFNRKFKQIMDITPSDYMVKYKGKVESV
jgi:AraC-like DNA-binding protein